MLELSEPYPSAEGSRAACAILLALHKHGPAQRAELLMRTMLDAETIDEALEGLASRGRIRWVLRHWRLA